MSLRPIYVDLDDVLCATARSFLPLLEHEFGRRVAFDEIRDFDLGVSFGLAPAELERFFELFHRPERLAALEPLPGAVETVRAWVADGHEVAVVTGRPPHTREASRQWLERHGVPHRELTFVDKYGRGQGGKEEGVVPLAAVGPRSYCVAIEDSLSTARTLAGRGLPVVLLDRPWNQGASAGAVRCRGWSEVARRVDEILASPLAARSSDPLSS